VFELALIIQIFVLLNPLSSFPFLIAAHNQKMNVKIVAVKAVIAAFIIAVIMALVGPVLFNIFGITLDSFRIAGGIVLFLLAHRMVRPKEEKETEVTHIESLTTIIATPMLTGPATISFITVKTFELGKIAVLSGLLGAFIIVGIVFFIFSLLVSRVNPKIVNILARILGLFLMAVSVEMIIAGLKGIALI
jgi:multiple antibiotic resistance protein